MTPTAATPDTEAWQLTFDNMPDDEFADGLRLSTDCVCRRLIEPLDPKRYHEFPEHLGHRGHGFERVMQEWLIEKHGATAVLREIVVPWEYGETHLDLLVDPDTAAKLWGCTHGGWLLIELKANKDGSVKSENVRQAQRQRFVIERAVAAGKRIRYQEQTGKYEWEWRTASKEMMSNLEYRVIVIDPTTWRIPNPNGVRIELRDERHAELDKEWEVMRALMTLPGNELKNFVIWSERGMEVRGAACTCGKCWTDPPEELPNELVEHAAAHMEAKEEEKYAADVKKYHGGVLYETFSKIRKPNEKGHPAGTWVGHGYKVTITKVGAVLTTKSDAEATPLI